MEQEFDTESDILTSLEAVEAMLPMLRNHLKFLEQEYKCKQIQRMVMDCESMLYDLDELKNNGPDAPFVVPDLIIQDDLWEENI